MEEIYSLIAPPYIQRLIDQGIDNPGLLIKNSTVPPLILTAVALIIYLIYLLRGLKNSNS